MKYYCSSEQQPVYVKRPSRDILSRSAPYKASELSFICYLIHYLRNSPTEVEQREQRGDGVFRRMAVIVACRVSVSVVSELEQLFKRSPIY